MLQIKDLIAGYEMEEKWVAAVDHVSLNIKKDDFIGLAGESGCGKSTLAFSIMGLLKKPGRIKSGSILFRGEELTKMSDEKLRNIRWRDISMVFQSAMNSLNPIMRIGDQIVDSIRAHKIVSMEEAHERAEELLKLVNISPDRVNGYPHQLSGGMKQRVMMAMALSLNPSLIIMDEPTTALDVVVQRMIIEEIEEIREKLGFSILFITHDLSLLVEISKRIAIMYAGEIVEIANSQELYLNPLHPYTQGLMNSFPTLVGPLRRSNGIPGRPPDLSQPIEGCRFYDRCAKKMNICKIRHPVLNSVGNNHKVACWIHSGDEDE